MSRKGTPVQIDAPSPSVREHGRPHTHSELTLPVCIEPRSPETDKPPYRVPSMAEIAALPWNGLNVVSTFSGCGGSCLGFKMAGYRVLWANEFIPAAQETYRANHPGTILDTRDIRTVTAQDILAAIVMKPGEIDVLEGSPPCASFSTAGKREKSWGKTKAYSDTVQRADDLFFEYTRLLRDLQPRTFVAENVSGLIKGTAKGYFKDILREMKACGYRVEAKLLDAQWLGVPQARQRIIFMGVRNDLELAPAFPTPLPYRYSVRDALPWISEIRLGGSPENWHPSDRPAGTVTQSDGARESNTGYLSAYQVRAETDISRYAIGAEWDKLAPGEQSEKYRSLIKADPERPSPTILQRGGDGGVATVTHPVERRKFTIAELRRICAFPDDFILTGSYAQQWERLGRSVPPVMMQAVATSLRDGVFARLEVA